MAERVAGAVTDGSLMPDEAGTGAQARHVRWEDIVVEPMSAQIGRQYVTGERAMLARMLLKKGAHVPRHSHENEQMAYILEGAALRAGRARGGGAGWRGAGDFLACAARGVALEDTIDLDIFTPPRQDWIDGDDAYLRQTGEAEA